MRLLREFEAELALTLAPAPVHLLAFSERVKAAGLALSMGRVGDAFDNAMMEAFWARLQTELLDRKRWRTRLELANALLQSASRSSTTASVATQLSWGCSHQPNMTASTPTTSPPDALATMVHYKCRRHARADRSQAQRGRPDAGRGGSRSWRSPRRWRFSEQMTAPRSAARAASE
jgi:hypothetical protein